MLIKRWICMRVLSILIRPDSCSWFLECNAVEYDSTTETAGLLYTADSNSQADSSVALPLLCKHNVYYQQRGEATKHGQLCNFRPSPSQFLGCDPVAVDQVPSSGNQTTSWSWGVPCETHKDCSQVNCNMCKTAESSTTADQQQHATLLTEG